MKILVTFKKYYNKFTIKLCKFTYVTDTYFNIVANMPKR